MKAYKGSIFHFLNDQPLLYQYWENGLLLVDDQGLVVSTGPAEEFQGKLGPDIQIIDYTQHLILPGLIDSHIHYPQTEMIGSYGAQLLEWLQKYTFPTEMKFSNKQYAESVAHEFINLLIANGTTTAAVFCTVHPESVDALLEVALVRHMRIIAGKVMMDRHAPDSLLDTPLTGYRQSEVLIEKWHQRDRIHYALTPRFAPTSSPEQLQKVGELFSKVPGLYLQTHLSENKAEVEWVSQLYPKAKHYLDVYDQYGLVTDHSIFGHAIHLCDQEWQRLATAEASIAFCPSSNLFLGSGLFQLKKAEEHNVKVSVGTDVGAGTSFSILKTLRSAYETQQLQGNSLSPFRSIYMATLGGAKALQLDEKIGNFAVGKEADFIVVDWGQPRELNNRILHSNSNDLNDKLFALCQLADDRTIKETYIFGKPSKNQ